jgi:predicted aspartyl protease
MAKSLKRMNSTPFIHWTKPAITTLLLVFIYASCHAFQIDIKNNRLTVKAIQVPMQDLLRQLAADYDIGVRIDPAINPPVTAAFNNRPLEAGLKSILKPHNHVLLWKANPHAGEHPSEPAHLLDEIHIFRPGEKGEMVDIAPPQKKNIPQRTALPSTKIIIKGNKVFVPVTLAYNGNEIQTTLLFDTGASSIVLHQNVADQLGIEEYQASQGRGVGGLKIMTKAAVLNYVVVGPHKKENLRTDIIEYQGTVDSDYNGLLGMNFIKGLKYTIDFKNQAIQWIPLSASE